MIFSDKHRPILKFIPIVHPINLIQYESTLLIKKSDNNDLPKLHLSGFILIVFIEYSIQLQGADEWGLSVDTHSELIRVKFIEK